MVSAGVSGASGFFFDSITRWLLTPESKFVRWLWTGRVEFEPVNTVYLLWLGENCSVELNENFMPENKCFNENLINLSGLLICHHNDQLSQF